MRLINLLPKLRQQELRNEAVFYGLLIVFSLSFLSFALVFLVQFGTKFYLEAAGEALNNEIKQLQSQVNKQENADLKKQIQGINDVISDFNNLANASPKWSKIIKAFAPLPPEGVGINSFNIDTGKKTISITGHSPTRELVIRLYNNILQDSKDFSNIDYPLENVAKPADISFHFTFSIQDQLLK
jgi:Tfp pilus assembly protein PilN